MLAFLALKEMDEGKPVIKKSKLFADSIGICQSYLLIYQEMLIKHIPYTYYSERYCTRYRKNTVFSVLSRKL